MKLSDRKWAPFMFTDVFTIRKGFYNKHPLFGDVGHVPFIGATDANNGITGMTTWEDVEISSKVGYGPNEPMCQKRFPGKCICVTNNGSVGYAYYQATDFTCSHDVNPLYLKDREFSKPLALFFVACIEKQRVCFEYARKWRPKRMIHSRIMLPVNESGRPDYDFMERYMKNMESSMIEEALQKGESDALPVASLSQKKWKPFYISSKQGGVFKITATRSGIDRNKLLGEVGNYPYITRTDNDNGWDGFVCEQTIGNSDKGNVISLGLDTQTAFYQPIPFYTGQNIQVLSSPRMTRHVALFIIPLVKLQMRSKFNWGGNGATLGRLHRMQIMLPVDNEGNPDYGYMGNYMKHIENRMLREYLAYRSAQ